MQHDPQAPNSLAKYNYLPFVKVLVKKNIHPMVHTFFRITLTIVFINTNLIKLIG
jgi:hypothetical protein